jgi:hypothetical protein
MPVLLQKDEVSQLLGDAQVLWDLVMWEPWSSSFSSVMDLLVESDIGPRHASTLSTNKELRTLENGTPSK